MVEKEMYIMKKQTIAIIIKNKPDTLRFSFAGCTQYYGQTMFSNLINFTDKRSRYCYNFSQRLTYFFTFSLYDIILVLRESCATV